MTMNMKSIKYILGIALVGLVLASCEDDIEKTVISADPTAPVLETPTASEGITYTKEDANNSIEFTWAGSDFGYKASITYGVQISPTSDFSQKTTLLTSEALSGTAKVSAINTALLSWKFAINEPATISARAFATVGSGTDSVFSEVLQYTVTPYEDLPDYPMIYVPGAYQGWSPGAENGRLFSYNSNSIYEGTIRLDGGDPVEFKVTPAANWDNSWGGSLTATSNGYAGTLDPSGGNFSVTAGTYEYTVDVNNLTIKLVKTDDWGIIGSAIPPYDWSADLNMFYNGQREMWEVTDDFKAGEFKFRANDAWDLNYGDNDADQTLDAGGANIQLPADGNYTIRLDLVNNTYTVQKN